MKTINFTKMAGAGNDFLVIDAAKGINYKNLAVKACNRTDGIGADGLLILEKSKRADYKMRIINADGSEAEMCGNGARCMAAYIVDRKRTKKKKFVMETVAGLIEGEAKGEVATIQLSNPVDYRANIPISIFGRDISVSTIDTGVPHVIIFVHSINHIDVQTIGREVRHHQTFEPRGTNVNFVEQTSDDLVDVRTFERGVEGETKACGTGSVASAIITYLKANPSIQSKKNAAMKVRTKSGEVLEVTFDLDGENISNVRLKGSAKFIARGAYLLH